MLTDNTFFRVAITDIGVDVMAKRTYFVTTSKPPFFEEKAIEFPYASGFAITQFQKSINNMHAAIRVMEGDKKILEVSTKSNNALGVQMSAFSLVFTKEKYRVENVFQASKKFKLGGPYRELLYATPSEAKRSELLRNSGDLVSFVDLAENVWPLNPTTAYYDWIYITAARECLIQRPELQEELLAYSLFTDIVFNHEKSKNCQARSLAMMIGMIYSRTLEYYMDNRDRFLSLYNQRAKHQSKQISMFDPHN